jgi:hypothetical protein
MFLAEFSLDTPVMRQIEHSPSGVVQTWRLTVRDIAQIEFPTLAEILGSPEIR